MAETEIGPLGRSEDYYFDSYSHYGIHEEMLKDRTRTLAYRDAVYNNKHLFKDKVVLDVGCGTGILCMFAAYAGAKKVVGVDCSSVIEQAKQIVKENGYEDTITLLKGRMEEVEMPEGCEKFDIIISEWMGYFLLYESMLNTVLWARDNLLKEGGRLFPERSTMRICAVEDQAFREEKIDFWDNICGFSFERIKNIALLEPIVEVVDPQQVMSTHAKLVEFDLKKVTVKDLSFTSRFVLNFTRSDLVHALVVYFDVTFTGHGPPLTLSTTPLDKATHWKQTVLYLDEAIPVCRGDTIVGTMSVCPNVSNYRDLDIEVDLRVSGNKTPTTQIKQSFRLR
ncbi:Protein arginine N-methyltransferase 1 [Diplonema papillatum]|nr:Protein arginine N-methyltransferase 1 [Diplonema papillatum]